MTSEQSSHSILRKNVKIVKPEKRITSDFLSLYEYQQIIAVRAKHIENGATIYVNIEKIPNLSPLDIAAKEILEKKCPLAILRYLDDDTAEYWDVNDLGVISQR